MPKKTINKGDSYWWYKAVWEHVGGWQTFRFCLRCHNVRNLAIDKYDGYGEDGPPFGELYEWIRETRRG